MVHVIGTLGWKPSEAASQASWVTATVAGRWRWTRRGAGISHRAAVQSRLRGLGMGGVGPDSSLSPKLQRLNVIPLQTAGKFKEKAEASFMRLW